MAARRLLAVMLVLLAISTVLAVVAPPPEEPRPATSSALAPTESPRIGRRLVRRIVVAGSQGAPAAGPEIVTAQTGDQISLTVAVKRALTLEAPTLGLTETASPGAPARFDLFASATGRHLINDAETGRDLAQLRIVSSRRNAEGAERTNGKTKKE